MRVRVAARVRTGLASMWRIVRSAMLRMCWGSMPAPRTRPGLSVSRQAEGAPGAFFTPGPQPVAGIETPPGTAAPEQRNEAAERPARGRPFSSALCVARCGGGGGEIEHGPNNPAPKTARQGGDAEIFPASATRARGPDRRYKRGWTKKFIRHARARTRYNPRAVVAPTGSPDDQTNRRAARTPTLRRGPVFAVSGGGLCKSPWNV